MTDSFVTQCPHCRTSFRISRAQLGAAHGAVRCGACMRVFNAAQQLLVDQNRAGKPSSAAATTTPPAAPAPAAASPTPPPMKVAPVAAAQPATHKPSLPPVPDKQSVDTLWIHDDLDLDSLDLDEELAKLEEQEMQLSREFLAMDKAPKPAEHLLHQPQETNDQHDESWAESLLKDEAPRKLEPVFPPSAAAPIVEPSQAPAATPTDKLHAPLPDETHAKREEPVVNEPDNEVEAEDDAEEIDDSAYRMAPAAESKQPRSEPALRNDSLLDLSDDPLQLDWQQPKKPWGRWLGWGLLNLLGAGALATQYISYHFEELARQDQYRPWFETLCPEIGCTLPSKVDISQIRSTNLVVRSHPQYMDALLVDAIVYNRAPFAQPFPVLELRFADINGQLIVGSRFRPSEYLSGELAGQAEMPPQTPIHISLEIKDPGARAVNYSLNFHSPE
ncbi:DUF3426 domain-containing protein [Pseudomonas sp. BMS12]|uniref:DUF3426 domain-containing protein n=1 Tax=Pseudomonas sp. BMS12 TaxID=1796033 RepID=UPI00083AC82B|nr:DUF3426 domain-containing protein [Pseudomonas sp. BMS12]